MYSCFAPASQILPRRRSFDCRRDFCHCRQIIFQLRRLIVDPVRTFFCSHIVNKGFLLFFIASALPHPVHLLSAKKPWVVVRSLQLEPGWPAPSPASKPDADEKFMTVCLENPSHSIWSAALPLMLPPLIAGCVCRLHSTSAFLHSGGSNHGERVGWRPWFHAPSLCSLIRHRFFSAVDWNETLIKSS